MVMVAEAGAKPELEILQARLGQLQRNLWVLRVASACREEELQNTPQGYEGYPYLAHA